jgi:uncharacterized protein YraI
MSKSKQTSSKTLKVKTSVKAGPRPKKARTLKVKTNVKAGCYGCSNARRWVNGWLGGMP